MEKCPETITKGNSDESFDFCQLTERPSGRIQGCVLMSGGKCEEWERIQEEEKEGG